MAPSSFREGPEQVELTVKAGSPLAEVFLVDNAFALVERSIGDLRCSVEPGVYKIKAKLGDAIAEQLILLDGDRTVDLAPDLPIGSAAPIAGTSRTREQDMSAASDSSARVESKLGEGARIFLMARLWRAAETAPDAAAAPPAVSLHGPDGEPLAAPDDRGDFARGATFEVDPGPYFLRWADASGVEAEQTVHAVQGWQTQVFVLEDAGEEDELGRTRVSMLMARAGFDPQDAELRLVEEARTALADERKVAADFLAKTVLAKLDNPMLGLYGAHLMLIARDATREAEEERRSGRTGDARPQADVSFDQQRFDQVVATLRDLLGAGHPDVVALDTQTTGRSVDALQPVTAPPMLWRSWVLLIDASNDAPELVPVSTWRRARQLLPLRPFLLWSAGADEHDEEQQWSRGLEQALATAKRRPEQRRGGPGPLAGLLSDAASEAARAGPAGVAAGEQTRRRVSRQLLAPRAAIDEVATSPES